MRERLIFVVLMALLLSTQITGLALADDPGNPDTCRVGCLEVIQPGQQVVVEVSIYNDEELGGLAIPLVFGHSPLDVVCDSVSFVGTRLEGADYALEAGIDTANYKLVFYAIYLTSNLPPGDGIVANLYFTAGLNWDTTSCVFIDTAFFPPTTHLEFSPRASGQALHPKFKKGCLSSGTPRIPELTYPSNQANVCSPDTFNFVWSKSGIDVFYTFQYAQDSAFTTGVVTAPGLVDTHYTASLSRKTYYWHVKASNLCGKDSPYQDSPFSFYVFLSGDATNDGLVDIADIVHLLNYLFKGGASPNPPESGDVIHDQLVDVSDVVYLLNYLFKGGPAPNCP